MKLKIKSPQPKKLRKTTLKRFLLKRTMYYVLPNVFFNFIIAYASFKELGYTHFFAGEQNLARLTLPMAIFLPVVLTIDIIKRVSDAANQEAIEFTIDEQLNIKKLMTRLSILYGLVTGLFVLSLLFLGQVNLSKDYKLDGAAMAVVVGVLAGVLSVIFVYLPVWRLRRWMCRRVMMVDLNQ
ncbi:hypothetical protein [Chryseobacterium indologenes]|uniref:Protein export membrane protein SecD/SecF C-terminal domain-containing protein n=1 Tax=Chryseobacterium indologenes TaxID=253 RepID=A0A0N0ZYT2_CHRID|nr:hypothetical protein [Chryseobacterium indologenes]KPE52928.1 hypothetical protein AOB46_02770 [Chryseobacterium indologenes]